MSRRSKNVYENGEWRRPCAMCGGKLLLSEFCFYRKDKKYSSYCLACMRSRNLSNAKRKYALDIVVSRKTAREKIYKHKQSKVVLVNELKSITPCADCGRIFPPVCMDFDHCLGEKRANIAALVHSYASMEDLRTEINKCEIVCACCHRIRTMNRTKLRMANEIPKSNHLV